MSILTVDFHTHILPCIDDGSQSVEESVRMIRNEVEQGVETVFLTPHFYAQNSQPSTFIQKRDDALEAVMSHLSSETHVPNMILGAETHYTVGMSNWDILPDLALGDTGYILIEMPKCKWTDYMFRELELIYLERRLIPIIAHVERYFTDNGSRAFLENLLDMPVLLQSNASFFIDKHTQRLACKLLNKNNIHLISTDCHGVDWRSPNMAQARDVILSNLDDGVAARLSEDEQAVLNGRNVFI